jgi:hypothetical protein
VIKAVKGCRKPYKVADSSDLHLFVLPSGQRYWWMNYRYLGGHKTRSFGVWPDVDLSDARAKRDDARRLLANSRDPSKQNRLDKIAVDVAAADTFTAVAKEWCVKAEKEGLAPTTLNRIRRLLDFAYPSLGNRTRAVDIFDQRALPGQYHCSTLERQVVGSFGAVCALGLTVSFGPCFTRAYSLLRDQNAL